MDHSGNGSAADHHDDSWGYEKSDANTRGIFVFGIFLAVFIVVTLVSMRWLYYEVQRFDRSYTTAGKSKETTQVSVYEDLKGVREKAGATLSSYAWVDAKAGVVRIPIERAIDLAAERGVPKGKGPKSLADYIRRDVPPQNEADLKKLESNPKK